MTKPIDPRALCAAEKYTQDVICDYGGELDQLSAVDVKAAYLAGYEARHAADPPESPAPPPEGFPPRVTLYWWPDGVYEYDISRYSSECIDVPMLSVAEHSALLTEAKQQGRLEAFREANIYTDHAYAGLMAAQEEAERQCRPTPSKGD